LFPHKISPLLLLKQALIIEKIKENNSFKPTLSANSIEFYILKLFLFVFKS